MVSIAVNPLGRLPVTVARSSEAPSLKTLSLARVTREWLATLAS
jgi:hypothetical protein